MSQTLGGEYVRGWFPVRHWLTLWGGLGRRCQGDIAAWGLQTAQDRQGRNCANVCACLFSPISMYHLKTIIASRRHWADGIVWILYSDGHSGNCLTSITEDVSQYGWICGPVSEHLIGPPAAPSGQIWTAHTEVLGFSLSLTLLQGDNVSFCLSAHFLNSSRWLQTTALKLSQ